MSRYNTVILSVGFGEIYGPAQDKDEDEIEIPPRDCEPLRQVNRWLKKQNYDPLEDIAGGWLGQNVCLFGGCYNKLDADEFCKAVRKAKWREIGDVRVLFWDEEDETFTLIPIPPKRPVRKTPNPA